eukprot:227433-Hanusia_phi.AAC.6
MACHRDHHNHDRRRCHHNKLHASTAIPILIVQSHQLQRKLEVVFKESMLSSHQLVQSDN